MTDIRAGKAYVEAYLDSSRLTAGLKQLRGDIGSISSTLLGAGAGFAAVGTAIQLPLNSAVTAAGAAQEEMNRFSQVLGSSAAAASEFGDRLSAATNRSAQDLRGSLATFQAFFRGQGFDAGPALQLSQALTELSVDFSSFQNVSQGEAISRFIAAMSGSSEVLDQFGINIKEAAINAELLNRGIRGGGSEAQRTLARVAIISRELGRQGALGDAARTAGSFANTAQGLSAAMRQLQVSIGGALIPMRTEFNQRLTAAIQVVNQFVSANPQLIVTLSQVATAFAAAGTAAIVLGTGTIVASATMGGLGTLAAAALSPLTALGSGFIKLGSVAAATASASLGSVVSVTSGIVAGTLSSVGSLLSGTLQAALGTIRTVATSALSVVATVVTSATAGILGTLISATIAAITAVGSAVTALIGIVSSGLVAIGGFIAGFGTIGTAAGIAVFGVGAFIGLLANLPVALTGGLVALAGVSLGLDQLGGAVQVAGQHFVALGSIAVDSFKGISSALLSGDIEGALKIAGAGLYAAWQEVLLGLLDTTVALFGEGNVNTIITAINVIKGVLGALVSVIGYVLTPIKAILSGISTVINFVVAAIGKLTGTAGDVASTLDNLRSKSQAANEDLASLLQGQADKAGAGGGGLLPEVPGLPQGLSPEEIAAKVKAATSGFQVPDITVPANLEKLRAKTLGIGDEFGAGFESAFDRIQQNPTIAGLQNQMGAAGAAFGNSIGLPPGLFEQVSGLAGGLKDSITGQLGGGQLEKDLGLPSVEQLLQGITAPGGPGAGAKGGRSQPQSFGSFSAFAAASQRGGSSGVDHLRRLRETADRTHKVQEKQLKEQKQTNRALAGIQVA